MTEALVKLEHLRALKFCSRGSRAFCERHGLDWARLVREGLPVEQVMATGDAMAQMAAERARSGR
jgi:hypothetical protein